MKSRSARFTGLAAAGIVLLTGSVAMLVAEDIYADTQRQESAGELLDDAVITTRVKAAFVNDERVSALRINVTSNKGILQLSGFANSREEAERAVEVARIIPGVKEISNDILLR